MLARLRSFVGILFRRSRWEQEMSEELNLHIQLRAEHLERSGIPRGEALRRARIEFGGLEAYKESCREARAARWTDELKRNFRYAARSMRKSPGFTAVAVLSLALGIGANIAVFNLLQRLVLTTLPVREPQRLYQVVLSTDQKPFYTLSCPKLEKLRDNFNLFDALFGWGDPLGDREQELTARNRKQPGHVTSVTGTYFESLGVRPALGRLLTVQDDRAGAADVAVISQRLWKTLFNGDPGILGGTLTINRFTFQIVGVIPYGFSGVALGQQPDVYLPLHAVEHFSPRILQAEGAMWFYVMARLKRDIPLATAQAVLREGWARLDRPRQVSAGDHGPPEILVLEDGGHGYSAVRQEFSRAILALMGLVGVVFLIACANLATLLFVRGAGRTRETSIRLALGAGRAQLIRQWMTECVLLAVCGGLAGLLAARWITGLLLQFVAEADRPWLRFQASPAVLVLALALTLAAGLLFGLLPAWRASRTSPETVLRERSQSVLGGRGGLAHAVLAGQLAASLVLVVGAVLFARTLWNLDSLSGGFGRKTVVYALPDFPDYPRDRIDGVLKDVVDRLNRSPHIAAASLTDHPPILWGSPGWGVVTVPGYAYAPEEDNTVYFNNTGPGYFRTMGIPMIRDGILRTATAFRGPPASPSSTSISCGITLRAEIQWGRRSSFCNGLPRWRS